MLDPQEPWEIETAFYIKVRGFDPDKARTFTMFRWLWCGDLRPLEAAICEDREIPQAVLNLLADMISTDLVGKPPPYRLQALPRRRGRPRKPERLARNLIVALQYETGDGKSDELFERIAKSIGLTDRTVRQAVTAWRKARTRLAQSDN